MGSRICYVVILYVLWEAARRCPPPLLTSIVGRTLSCYATLDYATYGSSILFDLQPFLVLSPSFHLSSSKLARVATRHITAIVLSASVPTTTEIGAIHVSTCNVA